MIRSRVCVLIMALCFSLHGDITHTDWNVGGRDVYSQLSKLNKPILGVLTRRSQCGFCDEMNSKVFNTSKWKNYMQSSNGKILFWKWLLEVGEGVEQKYIDRYFPSCNTLPGMSIYSEEGVVIKEINYASVMYYGTDYEHASGSQVDRFIEIVDKFATYPIVTNEQSTVVDSHGLIDYSECLGSNVVSIVALTNMVVEGSYIPFSVTRKGSSPYDLTIHALRGDMFITNLYWNVSEYSTKFVRIKTDIVPEYIPNNHVDINFKSLNRTIIVQ